MESAPGPWAANLGIRSVMSPEHNTATTEPDVTQGRLSYGGFIFWLQRLGINPLSVRSNHFGTPIGRGSYFSVSRHRVRPTNYRAIRLRLSLPGSPLFYRTCPPINTYVAFKRVIVNEEAPQVDVSDQGQLYAICREIQALVHPRLREHETIIKLQAVIWENGFGAGNDSRLPMWPTLVLEYCETTLQEYQLNNKPINPGMKNIIGSKIGQGLDALHSAEVFHGDLKSENVLIKIGEGGTLEPKLADFGCSVLLQRTESTKKFYIGGTEMWCAPECPGYFTEASAMAATDWYSFGLLSLRLNLDGRNPFEEMNFVPSEWSEEEKTSAIRFLKEEDCVYPLLCEAYVPNSPKFASFGNIVHAMLLANPIERMKAIKDSVEDAMKLFPEHIEKLRPFDSSHVDVVLEALDFRGNTSDVSSESEEDLDSLSLWALFSSARNISLIPNLQEMIHIKREGALNAITRSRLVNELSLILEENFEINAACEACCSPTIIDTDPHLLNSSSLIDAMQKYVTTFGTDSHNCKNMLSDVSPEELTRSEALYGVSMSPTAYRKGQAAYQLFCATILGFGTERNETHAPKILEDAMTSGNSGLCIALCQYAQFKSIEIPQHLPFRKWLSGLVLFSSGIPSEAFRVLSNLDPHLSKIVSKARSELYNGFTASFENRKLIDIRPDEDGSFGDLLNSLHLNVDSAGAYRDGHGNSLLHLTSGSDGPDVLILEYCITTLKIDKNGRNNDCATALLMACRAAREAKIIALLELGVDVTLSYPGGETPLHWLGLLANPGPVLKLFLDHGANLHAHVFLERALPNFLADYRYFYLQGSPLMWAIAMDNRVYVDTLLEKGADMNLPGPNGLTPMMFACRPRNYNILPRLLDDISFELSERIVYSMLYNWTELEMLKYNVGTAEQEQALRDLLSKTPTFPDINALATFFISTLAEAISESRIEIVEIILEAISHSMVSVKEMDEELHDYVSCPLNHPCWARHRLVHEASTRGDPKILNAVLSYGGSATDLDEFGRSALHMLSYSSNDADCVDTLVGYGALEVLDKRLEINGMTAFANAAANCNFRVASRLLDFTSETDCKVLLSSCYAPGMALKPLSLFGHFVAWSSVLGPEPLEYLLNLGNERHNSDVLFIVDINNGMSALSMAGGLMSEADIYDTEVFSLSRRRRAMKVLVEHFPEQRHLNWTDIMGNTALHVAAWIGNPECVTALLDAGANPNLVNASGLTPLDSVFMIDPPFLLRDRATKKQMIRTFEYNRNNICQELRHNGGKHALPLAIEDTWASHLPFPWVREMQARDVVANQIQDDLQMVLHT